MWPCLPNGLGCTGSCSSWFLQTMTWMSWRAGDAEAVVPGGWGEWQSPREDPRPNFPTGPRGRCKGREGYVGMGAQAARADKPRGCFVGVPPWLELLCFCATIKALKGTRFLRLRYGKPRVERARKYCLAVRAWGVRSQTGHL